MSKPQDLKIRRPPTQSIPNLKWMRRFQEGARHYNRFKNHIQKSNQYNGTDLGRRLYGAALALAPTISLNNFELVCGLVQAALLTDAAMSINIDNVGSSIPSASTLKRLIHDAATDAIFCASQEILDSASKVFLICDKGAGNKVENSHFVKIVAWYSQLEGRVKTFNVDTDESDSNTEACAKAIRHSLIKMFGGRSQGILFGSTTDSGGGGTGAMLYKELSKENMTAPSECYLYSFCTLHCIQLTLGNPIEHVLGSGGMGEDGEYKQTAMQLLHGIYNLQRNHESEEWKRMWRSASQDLGNTSARPKRIPAPILTRWWTVGVAAEFLLDHWDTIVLIVHGSIQCRTTDKAVNQIASGVQALMNNAQIKSDVHLIHAFHKHFLFPHFSFLQKGDGTIGGTPGFLNRHIAGRYFLMHSDLKAAASSGWRDLAAY